jgi:hypothetical protein
VYFDCKGIRLSEPGKYGKCNRNIKLKKLPGTGKAVTYIINNNSYTGFKKGEGP